MMGVQFALDLEFSGSRCQDLSQSLIGKTLPQRHSGLKGCPSSCSACITLRFSSSCMIEQKKHILAFVALGYFGTFCAFWDF